MLRIAPLRTVAWLPTLVGLAIACLVAAVAARPLVSVPGPVLTGAFSSGPSSSGPGQNIEQTVDQIDRVFEVDWATASLEPAAVAEPLQVFRRLSLALVGTAPSLEEIRQFESDSSPDRLQTWTARWIADSRFVQYFAARLGEAYVDPVAEDLKPHQRERFVRWLGNSLQSGRSYGELVRHMIAGRGILADDPAITFVAVELQQGDLAGQRLAARTSRAFLGQRIDCAQCHDHPFAEWTQPQFEGLAAYYGQVEFRMARLQDTSSRPFVVVDGRTQEQREVAAGVPYDAQRVPDHKHLRDELADWMTHVENRRFRRAIANRVWGLMFGRALVMPVDDLPNPPPLDSPDVLDILAADLAAHRDDLRRLIHVIVASRAFQMASTHEALGDEAIASQYESAWAVFPLTELGPSQMIRSMQQAVSLSTLRAESTGTLSAIRRYETEFRFVSEYGVAGDGEEAQASTIPHTVQRLSGNETRRFSRAEAFNAPGRIAAISPDATACLQNCYLACLSRRPTPEEQRHFLPQLSGGGNQRRLAVEDIYWTLFNSAEFCWNH